MDFIIKELAPELTEDFLDFMENRAHSNIPNFICYCTSFNMTQEQYKLEIEEKARALKGVNGLISLSRKAAEQLINDNILKGYLAYHNNLAIGWCNTNDKKRYSQLEFNEVIDDNESKTQAIACVAIAPEYRDKDAHLCLITRVCEDAKARGYEIVEAYPSPIKAPYSSSCMYLFKENATGCYAKPIYMYEQAGFIVVSENEKYTKMQKKL